MDVSGPLLKFVTVGGWNVRFAERVDAGDWPASHYCVEVRLNLFPQSILLQRAHKGKAPIGFDGAESMIDAVAHEAAVGFEVAALIAAATDRPGCGQYVMRDPYTTKLAAHLLKSVMPVPGP